MSTFRRFPDPEVLAAGAAKLLLSRARGSVRERGRFLLVLSGGRTPLPLYELLAAPAAAAGFPWSQTHVFWGDERCVAPGDPASNVGAAEKALLSRVPIPRANVHPPPVSGRAPAEAAERWEEELRQFFGGTKAFPDFDLVLLGVGQDGHTASLFPGNQALEERERWTAAVAEPKAEPPVPRVTLTLPVLNRARCVLFLAGKGKQSVLREIREDPEGSEKRYPSARVRTAGETFWYFSER